MVKGQRYFKKMLEQVGDNSKFKEVFPTVQKPILEVGKNVILLLDNGDTIMTTPVVDFSINDSGRIEVITQNTIYIKL